MPKQKTPQNPASQPPSVPKFAPFTPKPGQTRAYAAMRAMGAQGLQALLDAADRLAGHNPAEMDNADLLNAYLWVDYIAKALADAAAGQPGRYASKAWLVTLPDGTEQIVNGLAEAAALTGRKLASVRVMVSNGQGRAVFNRKGSQDFYTVERL